MKPAAAPKGLAEMIPLNQIEVLPWQPRQTFNEERLQELAASIREKGLLQPILVRPRVATYRGLVNTKGKLQLALTSNETELGIYWVGNEFPNVKEASDYLSDLARDMNAALLPYELVAGERRFRAAKIAGLSEIPCMVRSLDNKAVMEIQVIENLQREDLSPLEEARGFDELIKRYGYTADSLAAKLGKSRAYVYGMLKLCGLPGIAVKALAEGRISKSHAELIARLPNDKMRLRYAEEILQERKVWVGHESGGYVNELCSLRDAKGIQLRNFMVELKGAPFSIKDAELVPAAGACESCPKLTGNDRVLFPDGRADMCTDPPCFAAKKKANAERLAETARSEGLTVLDGATAGKLFSEYGGGQLNYDAGYVDLADQCFADKKQRSYKTLLGKDVEVVAAFDHSGRMHRLVKKDDAAFKLKEKGIVDSRVMHNQAQNSYREQERRRQRQERIRTIAMERAIKAVGERTWSNVKLDFLIPSLLGIRGDALTALFAARGLKRNYGYEAPELNKLCSQLKSENDAVSLGMQAIVANGFAGWAKGYQFSATHKKQADKVLSMAKITMDSLLLQAKREIESAKKKNKSKGKKAAPKR